MAWPLHSIHTQVFLRQNQIQCAFDLAVSHKILTNTKRNFYFVWKSLWNHDWLPHGRFAGFEYCSHRISREYARKLLENIHTQKKTLNNDDIEYFLKQVVKHAHRAHCFSLDFLILFCVFLKFERIGRRIVYLWSGWGVEPIGGWYQVRLSCDCIIAICWWCIGSSLYGGGGGNDADGGGGGGGGCVIDIDTPGKWCMYDGTGSRHVFDSNCVK